MGSTQSTWGSLSDLVKPTTSLASFPPIVSVAIMRTSLLFIAANLALASAQVQQILQAISTAQEYAPQAIQYAQEYGPQAISAWQNYGPTAIQYAQEYGPQAIAYPPRRSNTLRSTARRPFRHGSSMETSFQKRSLLPSRTPSTYRRRFSTCQ